MGWAQWTGVGFLLVLGVYLLARLTTAAYFKSKAEYEKDRSNAKR